MYEGKHFKAIMVEADGWRRLKCQTEAREADPEVKRRGGPDDEPRPHVLPISELGERAMHADYMMGWTHIPQGQVQIAGEWKFAYRFVTATDDALEAVIKQLDHDVEQWQRDVEALT